mgnify:CR=1 FL=1
MSQHESGPSGWVVGGGRPPADPAHNVTRALELQPDAIVVNLPSNDIARGYAVSELLANLDRIAGTAANAGVEVWVTTTQPASLATTAPASSASRKRRMLAVGTVSSRSA